MLSLRSTLRTATGMAALILAVPAAAQSETLPDLPELPAVSTKTVAAPVTVVMSKEEIRTLPREYQSMPVARDTSLSTLGEDGVETITRTRRIASSAPVQTHHYQTSNRAHYPTHHAPVAYHAPAYAPMVLDREQWIAECERRTTGHNNKKKGGIIGGLLGAIGGGFAGHEIAGAGDRLGGALIGGGLGGLAGILLGNLIAGDGDDDDYDCETVLNTYLEQYSKHSAYYAHHAAPVAHYPAYGYGYAQTHAYYPARQTVVIVPVTTYQQQRVIVRETVREEIVEVEGATRTIPPAPRPVAQPSPSPKLIKRAPSPKIIKK